MLRILLSRWWLGSRDKPPPPPQPRKKSGEIFTERWCPSTPSLSLPWRLYRPSHLMHLRLPLIKHQDPQPRFSSTMSIGEILCQRLRSPQSQALCHYHSLQGELFYLFLNISAGWAITHVLCINFLILLIRHLSADVDTDDFLKTGTVSMPMGVSGQAGKMAN